MSGSGLEWSSWYHWCMLWVRLSTHKPWGSAACVLQLCWFPYKCLLSDPVKLLALLWRAALCKSCFLSLVLHPSPLAILLGDKDYRTFWPVFCALLHLFAYLYCALFICLLFHCKSHYFLSCFSWSFSEPFWISANFAIFHLNQYLNENISQRQRAGLFPPYGLSYKCIFLFSTLQGNCLFAFFLSLTTALFLYRLFRLAPSSLRSVFSNRCLGRKQSFLVSINFIHENESFLMIQLILWKEFNWLGRST